MSVTQIDNLDKAVMDILSDYSDNCFEALNEVTEEVGKEAAKQVKSNANDKFEKHKGRSYANGWRCKITKGRLKVKCVVYNAYKPQLTHLLENGHAKVDGVGRVAGRPHIEPVNEWAEKEVVKRVTERLQK